MFLILHIDHVQAIDLGCELYEIEIKEAMELALDKMTKPGKKKQDSINHLIAMTMKTYTIVLKNWKLIKVDLQKSFLPLRK